MRVLIIESTPDRAERLATFLGSAEARAGAVAVTEADEARQAFEEGPWDALVLAHPAAPLSVREVVSFARRHGGMPVVVAAKDVKADGAVALMRAGATDVVEWDAPKRLGVAVRDAIRDRQLGTGPEATLPTVKADLASTVFAAANEAIMVTDATNRMIAVNAEFSRITGYAAGEVLGRDPKMLGSGRHDAEFFAALRQALRDDGRWSGELWNRRKSGEEYPLWLSVSCIRDRRGRITKHIALFTDITDRKRTEDRLREQATHDLLTGLPNRCLFLDRVAQALAVARRNGRLAALLFVDLDGFKPVNDKFGHPIGDQVLVEVAGRLARAIRESDTAARIGGDEFTVLLTGVGSQIDIMRIARKLTADLQRPYLIDRRRLSVGASVGIAVYPDHAQTPAELLALADTAMYRAKTRAEGAEQGGALVLARGPAAGKAA